MEKLGEAQGCSEKRLKAGEGADCGLGAEITLRRFWKSVHLKEDENGML
jgi:hypothetical protein